MSLFLFSLACHFTNPCILSYDLMLEWLYDVRSKCRPSEYAIVWMTFFIMPIAGVNAGIGIGAILSFVEWKIWQRRTYES